MKITFCCVLGFSLISVGGMAETIRPSGISCMVAGFAWIVLSAAQILKGDQE